MTQPLFLLPQHKSLPGQLSFPAKKPHLSCRGNYRFLLRTQVTSAEETTLSCRGFDSFLPRNHNSCAEGCMNEYSNMQFFHVSEIKVMDKVWQYCKKDIPLHPHSAKHCLYGGIAQLVRAHDS